MTSNVQDSIQGPYLRTSRTFTKDINKLTLELGKAYIDIANIVNTRTIGIFPINRSIVTGESWFITSTRQQTLRQVYPFTSAGNIAHGINLDTITGFTRIYGTFTDGSIWYPLPYVDVTASNKQINVIVNSTNIVITAGAGAHPTIVSGWVILEWISQP